MTDANHQHSNESHGFATPPISGSPAVPIFAVTFLAALGAAGAVFGLSDLAGLGVGVVIAGAGATVAAMVARKAVSPTDIKAAALLRAAMAEDAPAQPPSRFRGEPWFSLYARVSGYAEAQRAATVAVQDADRLRAELAKLTGVRDSASADHALEGEPIESGAAVASDAHDEPAEPAVSRASFEPRPMHAEAELVGGETPAPGISEADVATRVREAVAEAMAPLGRDLDAIVGELEPLLASLRSTGSHDEAPSHGHPAKMVDALVRTAADGIEDLAAGLMRANELAGVAERVTNRATLLALNAALEATRSGSEAFASIAEETRRLAEFAREATDTISRLSNEIELKVGETIALIQTGSQDAKAAVDSFRAGGASSRPTVEPATLRAFDALVDRVRSLRARVGVPGPVAAVATVEAEPQPSYVTLDATAEAGSATHAAPEPAPAGDAPAADVSPADAGPDTADDAAGGSTSERVPVVPRVVEKIPDWMEGLEPRDR